MCRVQLGRRARAHPKFLKLRPLTRLIKVISLLFYICFVIRVFLTAPSVSPEVMAKKQQLESMRKEHMFALKHEGDTMCGYMCTCMCQHMICIHVQCTCINIRLGTCTCTNAYRPLLLTTYMYMYMNKYCIIMCTCTHLMVIILICITSIVISFSFRKRCQGQSTAH